MDNERFSQVQFIASGGFAKVHKAFDKWAGKIVAVKELINATPDLLPRFKRERDMLTIHRNNPFVVDILDSNFDGQNPYLCAGILQPWLAPEIRSQSSRLEENFWMTL